MYRFQWLPVSQHPDRLQNRYSDLGPRYLPEALRPSVIHVANLCGPDPPTLYGEKDRRTPCDRNASEMPQFFDAAKVNFIHYDIVICRPLGTTLSSIMPSARCRTAYPWLA